MCGIVAYVGSEERAQDVILDGLRRLEYRGYDSAGLAVLQDGKLRVVRALGKLVNLEAALRDVPVHGALGLGHTRWATHGRPSEENAHPHCAGTVALIHNGIVENHRELREGLVARGCEIRSDTDTELIAHLIHLEREARKPLLEAVQSAVSRLDGSYAIAVIDEEFPDSIVVAKHGGSPVILGLGRGEHFVASDVPAILPYTRAMIVLLDGDVAEITPTALQIFDAEGHEVSRATKVIQWDPIQAEKGGYDRFMQKEIHEQPRAISDTIGTRVNEERGDIELDGIEFGEEWLASLSRIHLLGCGSAWHASRVAQYGLERAAGVPVTAELASEFRHRDPVVEPSHLVVAVSQSGETSDTLSALRGAKQRGAHTLAISNVHESTIAREAEHCLYTQAGPEIGVASTKCFSTQIVTLHLLTLKLGLLRSRLTRDEVREEIRWLRRLPRLVERTLGLWEPVAAIARRHFHARDFLFLGRGVGFPIALEGALKLKEISYIHAEGYAGGELKHGPIALIDEGLPVLVVANQETCFGKIASNAQEVRARGARVIAVVSEGDTRGHEFADEIIEVPRAPDPLSAVLATVPLQILAYHVATLKGTDVDQPRNLAKSVTVE
ncbi:MAG: glutamine--fructose-6-phosphate transaminase (isomerizing) [Myxococcota bacterium]